MPPSPLPYSFFARDTHIVARELLGKILVRQEGKNSVSGRIVEVESYVGEDDKASHASRGKTSRTEVMFGEAGHAYVYMIYGMYFCLNVVTGENNFPAAVLIRALEPISGIKTMQTRRQQIHELQLTNGPGKLCQALNITRTLNKENVVTSKKLFIIDDGFVLMPSHITSAARIGVEYAGQHAQLPWRYYISDNLFVSKK